MVPAHPVQRTGKMSRSKERVIGRKQVRNHSLWIGEQGVFIAFHCLIQFCLAAPWRFVPSTLFDPGIGKPIRKDCVKCFLSFPCICNIEVTLFCSLTCSGVFRSQFFFRCVAFMVLKGAGSCYVLQRNE